LGRIEDQGLDFQIQTFENDMKFDQEEVQMMAEASFKGVNYKSVLPIN
jgi:hypothetical protein